MTESEGNGPLDQRASKFESEVGSRLRVVESEFKNRGEAARAAGVAKSTFQRWVEGRADPSFKGLARLAAATRISLNWLATGQGPMRLDEALPIAALAAPAVDEQLMTRIAEGIAEVYRQENGRLSGVQLVRATARMYADLAEAYDSAEERVIGLKGMLQQLRRDLRTPPTGEASSKRLA